MTPDNPRTPPPAGGSSGSDRTRSAADSRPDLHLSQVLASALAATTAAVVGSTLGVAGTLVGAAVGSVVATSGGAVYAYLFHRTGTRVRAVVIRGPDPTMLDRHELRAMEPAPISGDNLTLPMPTADPDATVGRTARRGGWRLAAALCAAAFVLGMGAITLFEAIAGEPVSSLTTGDDSNGTSVGDVFGGSTRDETTPATPSQSPSTPPAASPTTSNPTPSVTATTPSSTPATTTPPSETPTTSPTQDPSGTPTPPPT